MKLRNKKTGEVKEFVLFDGKNELQGGASLKDLVEEWEDYEEPKHYWAIDGHGKVYKLLVEFVNSKYRNEEKAIGNYFDTREEAEKAVAKLKALANLRKRGLKFNGWDSADRGLVGEFEIYCDAVNLDGIEQELELVFGREEM